MPLTNSMTILTKDGISAQAEISCLPEHSALFTMDLRLRGDDKLLKFANTRVCTLNLTML